MDVMQAAGRLRRKLMQDAWENIDKGWDALQQPLIEVGMTESSKEGVLRLNVGGLHSQSVLSGQGFSETRTLASLFERGVGQEAP